MDMEEKTAKSKWLPIALAAFMEKEIPNSRWLPIALAAFMLSGLLSYSELQYLVVDKTVVGTVTQAYTITIEKRGWRPTTREVLIVEYAYKDRDGTPRTAKDFLPEGSDAPAAGMPVTLEYILGSEHLARLAKHHSWFAAVIPLACAAGAGWFVISAWRRGRPIRARERRLEGR